MSPSCLNYLDRLLKRSSRTRGHRVPVSCHVCVCCLLFQPPRRKKIQIVDGQTGTEISPLQNIYFSAKRAEILMHIIEHKIEYSITQEAEEMYRLCLPNKHTQGMRYAKLCPMNALSDVRARYKRRRKRRIRSLPPATCHRFPRRKKGYLYRRYPQHVHL